MLSINIFYFSILIHVLSAIAWVGSLIAMEFVFIPSFISISSSNIDMLINSNKRIALVAQLSSALILITGLYQTFDIGYLDFSKLIQTSFGNLILLKVLLYILFAGIGIKTGQNIAKIGPNISKEKLQIILVHERKILYLDLLIGFLIITIAIALVINV